MIRYTYVGTGDRLKLQVKSGWVDGVTTAPQVFVHGSGAPTDKLRIFGLSPEFASEFCVDSNNKPLGGGKLIFAMIRGSSGKPLKLLWGDLPVYEFNVPAGTTYYSNGGTIAINKEVAFPYVVEPTDVLVWPA